jgi:2'-5' RNA ligase
MAFIGIRLNEDLRHRLNLTSLQNEFRSLRWTHISDLHLTLRFMADGTEESLERILRAMTHYKVKHDNFTLKISHASTFEQKNGAGVLWLGFEDIPPALRALQEEFEDMAVSLGYERELRPFNPHITIGRYKAEDLLLVEEIVNRLAKFDKSEWTFEVKEVSLMKRRKNAGDSVYHDLILRRFEGR